MLKVSKPNKVGTGKHETRLLWVKMRLTTELSIRKSNTGRNATDTDLAGYQAGRKSGQSLSRVRDIRPDFCLNIDIYGEI
jgi:hypothetical protein